MRRCCDPSSEAGRHDHRPARLGGLPLGQENIDELFRRSFTQGRSFGGDVGDRLRVRGKDAVRKRFLSSLRRSEDRRRKKQSFGECGGARESLEHGVRSYEDPLPNSMTPRMQRRFPARRALSKRQVSRVFVKFEEGISSALSGALPSTCPGLKRFPSYRDSSCRLVSYLSTASPLSLWIEMAMAPPVQSISIVPKLGPW